MESTFTDKLNEIRRLIDEDVYRKRVLLLCQQQEPKSFEEYSSSGSFRRWEKFESSTYSEVLRAIDMADNNRPVVMKIMRALTKGIIRMLPAVAVKGCQSYNDILNELVVSQALSQLHDGVILNGQPNALYRTHFFCLIHEIKVVSGNLSRTLTESKRRKSTTRPSLTIHNPLLTDAKKAAPGDPKQVVDGSERPADQTGVRPEPPPVKLESSMSKDDTENVQTASSSGAANISTLGNVDSNLASNNTTNNNKEDELELEASKSVKDEEMRNLPEEERMLMESLPHEYVVSVMRHDGQPLWWMMTHKKLTPQQLTSVLVQVIVGLAIAENVYLYEHRDLHVSNILIKPTSNDSIPFILDGHRYSIASHGIKATIIDATFSRLTHNGKVYYRDLTSTLRAYGTRRTPTRMSLQNRSYREMVRLTNNKWDSFTPKTNLIWLTYLCETLMKNDIMKGDAALMAEVRKIRDHTLKVKTTFDLLGCFPKVI